MVTFFVLLSWYVRSGNVIVEVLSSNPDKHVFSSCVVQASVSSTCLYVYYTEKKRKGYFHIMEKKFGAAIIHLQRELERYYYRYVAKIPPNPMHAHVFFF